MDENTSQGMKGDSGNTGCCTKTRSKQPILKNESIIVKIRHVIHRRQTDKPVLKLQFQFDKLNGTSLHKVKGRERENVSKCFYTRRIQSVYSKRE